MKETKNSYVEWLKKNEQKERRLEPGQRLTGRYKIIGRYEGKKELKTKELKNKAGAGL